MIIGVDTSGKIGQFPVYLGVVRMKRRILDKLRKEVEKGKPVVAMRRRINARYLNENEINLLIKNVEYSVYVLKSPVFFKNLIMFRSLNDPETRILASSILIAAKKLIENNDILLIDKDYDYEKMKFLCSSLSFLIRKIEKLNVTVEIGTSYNEVIALADIVAALGRLGKLKIKEIESRDLNEIMEKF